MHMHKLYSGHRSVNLSHAVSTAPETGVQSILVAHIMDTCTITVKPLITGLDYTSLQWTDSP